MRRRGIGLILAAWVLALPGAAFADVTVNFDGFPANTKITNQYANLGGSGQGVVFGPLPGGVQGLDTVVSAPPSGQAQSGTNVADISTCFTCEFPTPGTTGTFAVPRSRVSVYAGLLGPPATCSGQATDNACAFVTLRAVDANGHAVASTAPTLVKQGAGVHTLLSVSTASARIVGFQIAADDGNDGGKAVAIDDLTFDSPTGPPAPDFTLTPAHDNRQRRAGLEHDRCDRDRAARWVERQRRPRGQRRAALRCSRVDRAQPGRRRCEHADAARGHDSAADAGLAGHGHGDRHARGGLQWDRRHARFKLTIGVKEAFSVRVEGSTDISLAACSVSVPVEVDPRLRLPRSGVAVGQRPARRRVTGSFSPAQATFPNGSAGQTISLDLTAAGDRAAGAGNAPRRSTRPRRPLPERTATFTVGGTCPMQYDPEVVSMQITQGTQLPVLPSRDATQRGVHRSPTRRSVRLPPPARCRNSPSSPPSSRPIVRVYADLKYGPATGVRVPAVLNGFRYDVHGHLVPLPGGPILPIGSPDRLFLGLPRPGAISCRTTTRASTRSSFRRRGRAGRSSSRRSSCRLRRARCHR